MSKTLWKAAMIWISQSDKLIFIKLRKRNASPMTMFVDFLGLFIVLQAVVAIIFTNQFRILTESFVSGISYRVIGGVVTRTHIINMQYLAKTKLEGR